MSVSDEPEFADGEQVLVFLTRNQNSYQVTGREGGKFPASSAAAAQLVESVFHRLEAESGRPMPAQRCLAQAFLKKASETDTSALTSTTTTTTTTTCYGTTGTKWGTSSAKYAIGANVPSAWGPSVNASAATWNSAGAAFQLLIPVLREHAVDGGPGCEVRHVLL